MGTLNLDKARSIIEFALNWREENGLNPLTVAVLIARAYSLRLHEKMAQAICVQKSLKGKRVARSVWELDHVHCSTARRNNHTSSNP